MKDRHFILLILLLVVLAELPFVEYITDDTFIHLQFAKNLVAGNGFSFNSGEPTYGFTSPLWVLLISALGMTGAGLLAASKTLGLVATALSAVFFYFLVVRVSRDRFLSRAAAVVWAANAWSLRWGISGMETSIVTAWAVASLYFFFVDSESGSTRRSVWILAIACLVRPEALILLAICAVALFLPRDSSAKRLGLPVLLSSGIVTFLWSAYAQIEFGRMTPTTVAVKAGRFISPGRLWEGLTVVGKIMGSTNAPEIALVAVVIVLSLAARKLPGAPSRFHVAALGWLVALPAAYVLRDVQVVSRYLVPVMPVATLYGFLSLRRLGASLKLSERGLRRATLAVAAGCVVINVSMLSFVEYPHTHSFSRDMRGSLVYLGKWFSINTPANTTIAIPDIGAFAFYSDRKVLDLGGLVTPGMIPILRDHNLDEVLTQFLFAQLARPDYVVDRSRSAMRLLGEEKLKGKILPVVSTSVSSLGITRPGRFYYTAYRIDWKEFENALPTPRTGK